MFYVVFDDALRGNRNGWTPDIFANTLREPLAAVGVKVLRHGGEGQTSCRGGFQALGYWADTYEDKLDQVEEIVDRILRDGPGDDAAR